MPKTELSNPNLSDQRLPKPKPRKNHFYLVEREPQNRFRLPQDTKTKPFGGFFPTLYAKLLASDHCSRTALAWRRGPNDEATNAAIMCPRLVTLHCWAVGTPPGRKRAHPIDIKKHFTPDLFKPLRWLGGAGDLASGRLWCGHLTDKDMAFARTPALQKISACFAKAHAGIAKPVLDTACLYLRFKQRQQLYISVHGCAGVKLERRFLYTLRCTVQACAGRSEGDLTA